MNENIRIMILNALDYTRLNGAALSPEDLEIMADNIMEEIKDV